jgi:hypothetical protein
LGDTFSEKVTIETDNRRLAFGVEGMMGTVVEGSEAIYFDPYPAQQALEEERNGILAQTFGKIGQEYTAAIVSNLQSEQNFTAAIVSNLQIASDIPNRDNGAAKKSREGKEYFCRYCGAAVKVRAKVCENIECVRKQRQEWQARYDARKAAGLVGQAAAEVATVEPPFVPVQEAATRAPMYRVPMADGMKAMTYTELIAANKAGTVASGTRIQAQPSERYYVVRDGSLEAQVGWEAEAAVPGPAATR